MTEGTDGGDFALQAGSLAEALDDLAGDLEGVERAGIAGRAVPGVEYRRNGVAFAAAGGPAAAFRLRAEIADAALRTPDTRRSERGPDWIELAPAKLDTFAFDRALAWFESAWRLAGEIQPETLPGNPRPRPH